MTKALRSLLLILFMSSCVMAQDSSGITRIGWLNQFYSSINAISVQDNRAYLSSYREGLIVLDVTNPANPLLFGQVALKGAGVSSIYRGHLFVANYDDDYVRIVDISNPQAPRLLSRIWQNGGSTNMVFIDDYAYLPGPFGTLLTDISDPNHPSNMLELQIGRCLDASINDSILYVANWYDEVTVFNVVNPGRPRRIGSFEHNYVVSAFRAQDHLGYFAVNHAEDGELAIFDLQLRTELSRIDLPGNSERLIYRGNLLYSINRAGLLWIFDVTSPEDPQELSRLQVSDDAYGMTLDVDLLYIAVLDDGIKVVDVSDPESPVSIGGFSDRGPNTAIAVSESRIVVGDMDSTIRVIEYDQDYLMHEIGVYKTPDVINDLIIIEDLVLIANGEYGISVINISDPENINEIARVNTPGIASRLVGHNQMLYVADAGGGVRIIDLIDPSRPVELSGLDDIGPVSGLTIHDSLLVTSNYGDGIRLFDLRDPESPQEIGRGRMRIGSANDVAVIGQCAFVPQGTFVQVFDIRNPRSPLLMEPLNPINVAARVYTSGHYLYIVSEYGGIHIYDVSNRDEFVEVGFYIGRGSIDDIEVVGEVIYSAEEYGVNIYDCSQALEYRYTVDPIVPGNFSINEVFPNPFNSSVQISFTVGVTEIYKLSIVDLSGREIAQLCQERISAGLKSINWNADELPSGSYIIQLSSNQGTVSRNARLIK